MQTTVTGRNQVTIPAKLAAEMEIVAGTRLEWRRAGEQNELQVRVLPSRASLAQSLRGAGRPYLKEGQDPVADLLRERSADARERPDPA
jgi:bifunctional DNA-binding transcriptional regulator/antitoxin component of YhaV-PrlF toxin-antitoxin module